MQQTSLDAYHEIVIPRLSESQKEILKVFEAAPGPLTMKEAAELTKKPINCVTPRVLELRNAGFIQYACMKENAGIRAMGWTTTNKKKLSEV